MKNRQKTRDRFPNFEHVQPEKSFNQYHAKIVAKMDFQETLDGDAALRLSPLGFPGFSHGFLGLVPGQKTD